MPGLTSITNQLLILVLGFTCRFTFGQPVCDQVNGNLIQFNDNGAWCWFQDERAVIATKPDNLIVGSVASGSGTGGQMRNGSVEAVIFNMASRIPARYVLAQWSNECDDHNAPGLIVRPDGKYLAIYARHYDKYDSHYRIFNNTVWEPEQKFDWTSIPGGTDYTIAYSNLYYLSSEDRIYNFARANHRSPNFIFSDDLGDSWHYGGQLTTNSSHSYNKGYYKYWGNGVDRIDFTLTEQHPRDTSTSIYHGFIKNGKCYASRGTLADSNIFDTLNIPTFRQFTRIFADGTIIGGDTMRRCWIADLVRYDDNTLAVIVTARLNNNQGGGSGEINPRHAFIYCHFDGFNWTYNYLCRAGLKMYASEQDYTGLGALCPDNPNTIYLSTSYDPRTGSTEPGVHEIYRGTTADFGATWTWTPVTMNSKHDNYRPIIPRWDANHTALIWWRGTYNSAQDYDAAVVGVIYSNEETAGLPKHIKATTGNTRLLRDWLSSANGENIPLRKTRIILRDSGSYDIWVNFRGYAKTESRIMAGLSPATMQIFRQRACKCTGTDANDPADSFTGGGDLPIYQAYLGRIKITERHAVHVYIDGEYPYKGRGNNKSLSSRDCYVGISYSRIVFP